MSPEPWSLKRCCPNAKWTFWKTADTLWWWRGLAGQPNSSWSSSSCSKTPGVAPRSPARTINNFTPLHCFTELRCSTCTYVQMHSVLWDTVLWASCGGNNNKIRLHAFIWMSVRVCSLQRWLWVLQDLLLPPSVRIFAAAKAQLSAANSTKHHWLSGRAFRHKPLPVSLDLNERQLVRTHSNGEP